jgi:prepilin-type N-terminal cleavage/methylation domain-containing protein
VKVKFIKERNMQKHIKLRKNGFTLIELLVVVAIIAVLISILLPSLSQAREQARLVACGSNLRQLGIAIYSYTNDYNGTLPQLYYQGRDWTRHGWAVYVSPYLARKDLTNDCFGMNYMRCPSTLSWEAVAPLWATNKEFYSYAAHYGYGNSKNENIYELPFVAYMVNGSVPWVKIDRVRSCYMVVDGPGGAPSPRCYMIDTVDDWMSSNWRHNLRASFLFSDGSASSANKNQFWANRGSKWW